MGLLFIVSTLDSLDKNTKGKESYHQSMSPKALEVEQYACSPEYVQKASPFHQGRGGENQGFF